MRSLTVSLVLFGFSPVAATAQPAPETAPAVQYEVRFDNAVHHEAEIQATWRGLGDAPLRVEMSRSSPGRYAIHEFAKNVYSVSASDGAGRPLTVQRSDPYGWTVTGHDGTVTFRYTLYADRGDGTYSQIDATHAHLNMPATFAWARGQEARPIFVRFHPYASDWKVATQLAPAGEPNRFRAPNLQYFMDSPTELSDHDVREWQVADGEQARTIRIALHHDGTSEDLDRFAAKAKNVVREQIEIFGDVPDFDFGSYTFLADYLPQVDGDGMEHRNSTVLTSATSLHEADFAQLGTLSHEFFHAWNVERLRPAELEPFDFSRANPTPSLWLAEGFTSYYGPLAIRRAGESSLEEYLATLAGQLGQVMHSPARRYGSPQEMSLRAPFVDAARSIDPANPNIFLSYYTWGAVLAAALDLQIRAEFPGKSLDDWMRHLWRTHGRAERPYQPDDLRASLAAVTNRQFADRFFESSIEDSKLPDMEKLLGLAGLRLRPQDADRAWLGPVQLEAEGKATLVGRDTEPGTPLYQAGVGRGDEILSLGRFTIDSVEDWQSALERHRPGDEAELRFLRRGEEVRAIVRFGADPAIEIVPYEAAGLKLGRAQRAFRLRWLGD